MRSPQAIHLTGHEQSTRQIDIRTLWGLMGSPTAVGFPLIIFLATYPAFIGWFQEPTPELALQINIHLFDVLGGVGAATAVLLLRLIVKRIGPGNRRTAIIAVGWFVAGYCAAALQYAVALSAGPMPPIYQALLPFAGVAIWPLCFCFTTMVAVITQNQRTARELAIAKNRLDLLQANIEAQVTAAQQQLQLDVQQKINPVLESLSSEIEELSTNSTDASKAATTQQFRAVALDLVRPLSHELYSAEVDAQWESDPDDSTTATRVTLWQLLSRRMDVSVVFNAALPALLILAFFSSTYFIAAGWLGVLIGCFLTTAMVVAVMMAVHRLTRGRQLNALVVLALGILAALLLTPLYLLIPSVLNVQIPDDLLAFVAGGVVLVLMGSTVFAFFYDMRLFVLNRNRETNEENASLVARSRQQVWLRQKQIAKIVHGSIQSRLNAARIRLTQATTVTPELVQAVLEDLESARHELALSPAPPAKDIHSQLRELTNFWQGICEITYSMDDQSRHNLDADVLAAQAVMEVVSEGVSNAVKHSQAEQVHVTLGQRKAASVSVDLSHPSTDVSAPAPAPSPRAGLGSQILNQLTLAWSFEQSDGRAVLHAEIPVSRFRQ